ncbi:hypothetical protein KKC32_02120 [Patescibacteria group bacterium]|nr:hypothetical protein [Patescibacteria group bacterium]
MKKIFLAIIISALLPFIAGCTKNSGNSFENYSLENQSTPILQEKIEPADLITDEIQPEETKSSNELFSDWKDDLPKQYNDLKETDINIDGDHYTDKLITYINPNVIRREGDIRKIKYLKIFRKVGSQWEKIKEDEVTMAGGVVEMNFCILKPVNLGGDKKEEVLVSKCSQNGSRDGYYIFGQNPDGLFDDLPVPRGYLHDLPKTLPGENPPFLIFVNVTEKRIYESYGMTCESRRDRTYRAGDAVDKACRKVALFIDYNNGEFSQPTIEKEEIMTHSKSYDVSQMGVTFNKPDWLTPVLYIMDYAIRLEDAAKNEYHILFGSNLEALNGSMLEIKDNSILDNGLPTTQNDVNSLLDSYCDYYGNRSFLSNSQRSCGIKGNIAIAKIDQSYISMIRLYPGTRNSVQISFSSTKRNINYFDEEVMTEMIDSFNFK